MSLNPDVYISLEREEGKEKEKETIEYIKKCYKEHGKTEKFFLEAFGKERTRMSSIGSMHTIYLAIRSEGKLNQLDDHHLNRIYAIELRTMLREFGFEVELCDICDFCTQLVYESNEIILKACSSCKSRYYCTTKCQKSDWFVGHKEKCVKVK